MSTANWVYLGGAALAVAGGIFVTASTIAWWATFHARPKPKGQPK